MQRTMVKTVAGMATVALMGLGMAGCSEDATAPAPETITPAPEMPVVTEGLVAYVAMDGRVVESTGKVSSKSITKVGMTPVPDRTGAAAMAMYFDGEDDMASLPGLDAIQVWPLTWSFWIRTDGGQKSGLVVPIGKFLLPNGDGMMVYWRNNLFMTSYAVNNFDSHCFMEYREGISPNYWHHLVITLDHVDGMIVYIDNYRASVSGWTGPVAKSKSTEPLRFGIVNSTEASQQSVPFKGAISDFAVYNRVLTKEERTALYTSTK